MVASYAALITLVVGLLVVALALFLSGRRLATEAAPAVTPRIYRTRAAHVAFIAVLAALALAFTLSATPYPARFAQKRPDLVVQVTGQMWTWTLTPVSASAAGGGSTILPAGKRVEFAVTSKDIIHYFGIYNSAGNLIAQVAAVPGHISHLFYTFTKPGSYYVICLTYCGVAHHSMNTEFEVQ